MLSNSKVKIIPESGINRYHMRGCNSFEFKDPTMQISLPASQTISLKEMHQIGKKFRKIGKVHCYQCKYLDSGQCQYSRNYIREMELSYKREKVKCYYCNSKTRNFYEYLLNYRNGKYICADCERAKKQGTLKEKLQKELKPNWADILEVGIGTLALTVPMIGAIISWINGEKPDSWLLFISLAALFGAFIAFTIIDKERKKKKLRLNELN